MDEEAALGIVGQIYADFCRAESSALVVVDSRTGFSSVVAPRADPAIIVAYQDFWWRYDPTAKATSSALAGNLTTLDDTGRPRFFGSTFYNEFWRMSGLAPSASPQIS